MKNEKLMGMLLATAVAGFLGANANAADAKKADKKAADHMYCQNGCKGHSSCKGHGNDACDGKNGCAGQGEGIAKAKSAKECKKMGGKWAKEAAEAAAPAAAPAASK